MKGSVPRAALVAFLGLHMQHSLGQDTLVAGFLAKIILCVVSSLAASFSRQASLPHSLILPWQFMWQREIACLIARKQRRKRLHNFLQAQAKMI